MKNILLVVLMMFSLNVSAQINTVGLSDNQIAELQLQIAKMNLETQQKADATTLDVVVDKLSDIELSELDFDKYSQYGEKAAKVITGFAKEVGISINEFLNTKWGVVAAVLVAWHYYGGDMSLIIFSMGLNLIFLPVWIALARSGLYRLTTVKDRDGETVYKRNSDTPIFKRQFSNEDLKGDVGGTLAISLVIFTVIQLIVLVNIG